MILKKEALSTGPMVGDCEETWSRVTCSVLQM